ncbi:MAG TPA: hypothetical protein VFM09_01505 [Marmoricola sp.]|nr:hypothetical protein [Marmoricola sp.]
MTAAPRPAGRSSEEAVTFGLAPQLRARLMGFALLGLGLLLVLVSLVVALLRLPPDLIVLVAALVVVAIFALGFVLVRRWFVVKVDATGYQVRFVRGAGVRAARWTDVEDVQTQTLAEARCVVLRLRDGRRTTVPVDLIEGDRDAFVRELQRRLDQAHGRGRGRRR